MRLVGAVLGLAALVRLAATWNDLWLDEVWTLTLIAGLHSPLEIVTALHHDNNHVLNTMLMYLLRPLGSDWAYRIPAWIAGMAAVVLAIELATSLPPRAGSPAMRRLVAAVFFAASHPLVHYGSESRGYALALAFGLGALVLAVRDGLAPRSPRAPACWALLVLAMLSHALAVHVLVALAAWGVVHALRRDGFARGLATSAWWLAVPAAAFAVFYLGFLRGITAGGGPRGSIADPLQGALAVFSGLPVATPLPALLLLVLATTAAGVVGLARTGSDLWVLFAAGIVASPLALALAFPTDLYFERHFFVSATLWLVLMASLCATIAARGPAGTAVTAALLAAFVGANGARVAVLLRDGRGGYRAALEDMARRTAGDVVEVASDHDFRNRLLVEHYAPRVGKSVRYRPRLGAGGEAPEWYVAHRSHAQTPPLPDLALSRGSYRLVAAYPTAMLSGFAWFVYRRASPAR